MDLNEMALKIADDAARSTIKLYCVGEAYDNGPMWYTAQSTDFQDQIDEAIKYLKERKRIRLDFSLHDRIRVRVDVENFDKPEKIDAAHVKKNDNTWRSAIEKEMAANNLLADMGDGENYAENCLLAVIDFYINVAKIQAGKNPMFSKFIDWLDNHIVCKILQFGGQSLQVQVLQEVRKMINPILDDPVDMILFCPCCGKQHIDAPEKHPLIGPRYAWNNPPHRTHLCAGCGTEWRPADIATNGIAEIKTKRQGDGVAACGKGLEERLAREEFLMKMISCKYIRGPLSVTRDCSDAMCLANFVIEFPIPNKIEERLALIGESRLTAIVTTKDLINIGMRYAEKLAERMK